MEICGYPKFKDELQMWTASGEAKEVEEDFIKSQIITSIGQSGSPMIKRFEGEEYIVGIHIGSIPKKKRNIGLRLTEEKRKIIGRWVQKVIEGTKFAETNEKWVEFEFNDGDKYEGEWKDGQ